MVYWDRQVARTRCRRRKAKRQEALEEVRAAFDLHAITQRLAPQMLVAWHAWATDRVNTFQRAASAVEGRNGSLSHMHHHHRGVPKRRYAALYGMDGAAQLRLSRRRRDDARLTVFQTIVSRPL
jgi:hypothetical protein